MSVSPIGSDIEENQGTSDPTEKRKSSAWTRFKKKWARKGIVDVDVDHHRYEMLNCMRDGIREVTLQHPEFNKSEPSADDHTDVFEKAFVSPSGKCFHFTSYASATFVMIRQAIGISDQQYANSLAPLHLPYLEFMSNSKSGADFFLSNDKCLFMKTDKEYYINIFRSFLPDYLHHFQQYPHSLIVKIMGLYSIKIPGQKKLFFLVMQSIFYPDNRIEKRFDVKGCFAGRYQKPSDKGARVLKDQNFTNESIDLGDQRDWFVKQIKLDAEFMSELGVQDYSLLVGIQFLSPSDKKESLLDVVIGVQKSLKHNSPSNDLSNNQEDSLSQKAECDSDAIKKENSPHKSPTHMLSFYKPSIKTMNLRLLPNCKNSLHTIDGPEQRYYIGVIDFFTLYECRQRTGRFWKNIKYCFGDHSTIPPKKYADRFIAFITEHTT